MADGGINSLSNAKLPRWLAIAATAAGILILGVGMSRFVRMEPMRETLLPMLVGSVMVYISGFEKRLSMEDDGVRASKCFWGRKKESFISWNDVDDARVILNKGKNTYVLLHSVTKIPPFILKRDQSDEVIELLNSKLKEDRVIVER